MSSTDIGSCRDGARGRWTLPALHASYEQTPLTNLRQAGIPAARWSTAPLSRGETSARFVSGSDGWSGDYSTGGNAMRHAARQSCLLRVTFLEP